MSFFIYSSLTLISLFVLIVLLFWFIRRQFQKMNSLESPQISYLNEQNLQLQNTISQLQNEIHQLHKSIGQLETENALLKQNSDQYKHNLEFTQKQIQESFENISNRIFEKESQRFLHLGKETISGLVHPLQNQLLNFEKQVQNLYFEEGKERASLKTEIKSLVETNQQMSLETHKLTEALTTQSKVQGNWGELVIERILERSGLREGEEFIREGKSLNLKDDSGAHQKPDVIIRLPENKQIVIDCKVSLKNYYNFLSANTEIEQKNEQKALITSIYRHLHNLNSKKYHINDQLISPEFVLMFIPIESVLAVVLKENSDLFHYAWNQGIVIVTPSTLLATLRTVSSLWQQEKRTKNAMDIALHAGKIHDKFVVFLKYFQDIGDSLQKSTKAFDEAKANLITGKGNLLNSFKHIAQLGAKSKKTLPENWLNQTETEDDAPPVTTSTEDSHDSDYA